LKHTIEDFFADKINELHQNIDRIEAHLDDTSSDTPSGQRTMLAIQQEHLEIIEHVKAQTPTFEQLFSTCKAHILENERRHNAIQLRSKPIYTQQNADWWQTLHLIQFWSDFLNEAQKWHQEHTA